MGARLAHRGRWASPINGLDRVRARGWTYWHHVFNPRQLLLAALIQTPCENGHDYPNLAYTLNVSLKALRMGIKSRDTGQSRENIFRF